MAVPIAGSGDLHFSAGPVVADGIIAQVLAQLIQQGTVAVYKSALTQTGQRDISPAGIQLLTLHALLCNAQQIDRFHFGLRAGLACIIQTGELQDIIDQLDHAAGFHMDLLRKARHILRLCNAGLNELCITGNAGQRGLEFMADIGGEFLPHLLVVLAQDAVGMDALCKGDQLFVGHIVLNMVKVFGHAQHRLHQRTRQQGGQHSGSQHQRNTAQHDGRNGGIVDRPHSLGVLCSAQDLAVRQQHCIIVGLIPHSLRVPDIPADTADHGLPDLRPGKMIFHGLICGGFKQHATILRDQSDAQIIGNKRSKLLRILHQIVSGTDQFRFPLKAGPCLCSKGFMKHKDAQCRCKQQTKETHQKQTVADLFFHAAQLHSSPASSSSVSL